LAECYLLLAIKTARNSWRYAKAKNKLALLSLGSNSQLFGT